MKLITINFIDMQVISSSFGAQLLRLPSTEY